MNKDKTLFVLAAGSSYELGMPLGSELKEMILKKLSSSRNIEHYCDLSELSIEELNDLVDRLQRCQFDSIDDFLCLGIKDNKKAQLFLKTLISEIIIECEAVSDSGEDTSYYYIWNYLYKSLITSSDPVESLKANLRNCVFISFNYDRTLEHFLYQTISSMEIISKDELYDVLACINVFHVHGVVGLLPWEKDLREYLHEKGRMNELFPKVIGGVPSVVYPFRVKTNEKFYNQLWYEDEVGLFACHENQDASCLDSILKPYIWGIDNVFILGFGFHESNKPWLSGTSRPFPPKVVACSCCNLLDTEKNRNLDLLKTIYGVQEVYHSDTACQTVKEFLPLLN